MSATASTSATPAPAPAGAVTPYDIGLFAVMVIVWGTSWIALRLQLGVVAPEVSLTWRFLIAGIILFGIALHRRERLAYALADHARLAALGVLMFSTNFILFYHAGLELVSGILAVIFATASAMSVLLERVLLGRRATRRVVLGALTGLVGVGLLFAEELVGFKAGGGALGALLLALAGTLSFCLGSILFSTLPARGVRTIPATAWGLFYGTLWCALLATLLGGTFTIETTVAYLGALAWLAVFSSAIAFITFLTLVRRIGSARAGYATVLFPLVALAISTVAEGYHWTVLAVAGLLLVGLGNLLVLGGKRA